MLDRARRRPLGLLGTLGLLGAWAVSTACGHAVGDACAANVECSPLGDRICDTAQRGGYCTVEGCGATSCPNEAACIRFFPAQFLSVACDPRTEDAVDPKVKATNHCTPDEICLDSGRCAQRGLERRFCMLKCDADSDCRSGYECRRTGTGGAEVTFDADEGRPGEVRFCAQRP